MARFLRNFSNFKTRKKTKMAKNTRNFLFNNFFFQQFLEKKDWKKTFFLEKIEKHSIKFMRSCV